jgi:LacI family transcriptional regulator
VFEQHQVRGLIVSSHLPIEDRLAAVRSRGTPSVLVGQAARSHEQASVSLDDVDGGRQAMDHLLSVGCRRIAFVGGPLGIPQVADRLAGASEAVSTFGGGVTLEVINQPDRTIRGGREVAAALVTRPADQRPDGVFAVNDLLALGMLQTLVSEGVRVPEDLALVGYDDTEFSEASIIPLSTVRGRHEGFGVAVVDLLFDVMEDSSIASRHRVFKPELVARASTLGFVAR